MRWTTRWVCLCTLGALLGTGEAGGGPVTVPLVGPGGDSGWAVTYDDSVVDVAVDGVDFGRDHVLLEISKDFLLPPSPETGLFPPLLMDFVQRLGDEATVGTIRILDESLTNLTGEDWTDFHWRLLDEGDAWFDVAASGAFGIQPPPHFQIQGWETLPGEPGKADGLLVFDGLVAAGSSYFPGVEDSDLVIRTDRGGESPVSFTLKEFPTPEPATVVFVGVGLAGLMVRRDRRQRG